MSRLARLRRILFRTSVVLVLLAIGLVVAVAFYLRTDHAACQVRERLAAMLGVPVEMDSAQINLRDDSSVANLRLMDEDDRPFLEAGQAVVDLSVLGYLRSRLPQRIDLLNAHVRLRFDANGNLLTGLPWMEATGGTAPGSRIVPPGSPSNKKAEPPSPSKASRSPRRLDRGQPDRHPRRSGVGHVRRDRPRRQERSILDHSPEQRSRSQPRHAEIASVRPAGFVDSDRGRWPKCAVDFYLQHEHPGAWVGYQVVFDNARNHPAAIRPKIPGSRAGPGRADRHGIRFSPGWNHQRFGVGCLERESKACSRYRRIDLELQTDEAIVDQQKLSELPYVPPSVWQQVQASGRTSRAFPWGSSPTSPMSIIESSCSPKPCSSMCHRSTCLPKAPPGE